MVEDSKEGVPCKDCGVSYPGPVMEYDHVPGRGDKLFGLAALPLQVDAWTVRREMAKCDLLCANCHRLRTIGRGGKEREYVSEYEKALVDNLIKGQRFSGRIG